MPQLPLDDQRLGREIQHPLSIDRWKILNDCRLVLCLELRKISSIFDVKRGFFPQSFSYDRQQILKF